MEHSEIEVVLWDALQAVSKFIAETTGHPPTQAEIARAIKRYFVLKEIKEHIEMEREQEGMDQNTPG